MSMTQFPKRFGKYILLDRLSSGGMAEVYRAKLTGEASFQRLVAIKVMLPQLVEDEQFITMFIDEAKLAAQLSHPNIVQILELGRIGGQLYIAMDLVIGHDLRRVVKRAQKLGRVIPIKLAAYVIARAAEGLDFAHRQRTPDGREVGLVHRDVSPQNLLLSYDGDVKVVDFGIAKAEERATKTRAGVLKGKFAYMAPEQALGRPVDRRADIFGLGAVFYEIVAGKKLFDGESDLSILDKVRRVDMLPIEELLPTALPAVHDVLRRALAHDPANRFDSASDMAEALASLLIEDRTIFGTKQAGEWMRDLYADELNTLAEQMQRYLAINEEDLVETTTQRKRVPSEQVFESAFSAAKAPPTAPAAQAPAPSEWLEGKTVEVSSADVDEASARLERSQPQIQPEPSDARARVRSTPGRAPIRSTRSSPWVLLLAVLTAAAVGGLVTLFVVRPSAPPRDPVASPDVSVVPQSWPVTPTPVTPPSAASIPPPSAPMPSPSAPPESTAEPSAAPRDDEDAAAEEANQQRRRIGYVTVRVLGVATAKVLIDGEEVGYAPVFARRLRLGKHTVAVVEVSAAGVGRSKNQEIVVKLKHTRRVPLKVVLKL